MMVMVRVSVLDTKGTVLVVVTELLPDSLG